MSLGFSQEELTTWGVSREEGAVGFSETLSPACSVPWALKLRLAGQRDSTQRCFCKTILLFTHPARATEHLGSTCSHLTIYFYIICSDCSSSWLGTVTP